jgi:hypothetical protein
MRAFTLIEVMIASGILFFCLFAILGLLANTLRNARALQRTRADAGIVAAFFSVTNSHQRELETGNFDDLGDFGDRYRDLEWTRASEEVSTNGLWLELYTVRRRSTGQIESSVYRLVYDEQPAIRRP